MARKSKSRRNRSKSASRRRRHRKHKNSHHRRSERRSRRRPHCRRSHSKHRRQRSLHSAELVHHPANSPNRLLFEPDRSYGPDLPPASQMQQQSVVLAGPGFRDIRRSESSKGHIRLIHSDEHCTSKLTFKVATSQMKSTAKAGFAKDSDSKEKSAAAVLSHEANEDAVVPSPPPLPPPPPPLPPPPPPPPQPPPPPETIPSPPPPPPEMADSPYDVTQLPFDFDFDEDLRQLPGQFAPSPECSINFDSDLDSNDGFGHLVIDIPGTYFRYDDVSGDEIMDSEIYDDGSHGLLPDFDSEQGFDGVQKNPADNLTSQADIPESASSIELKLLPENRSLELPKLQSSSATVAPVGALPAASGVSTSKALAVVESRSEPTTSQKESRMQDLFFKYYDSAKHGPILPRVPRPAKESKSVAATLPSCSSSAIQKGAKVKASSSQKLVESAGRSSKTKYRRRRKKAKPRAETGSESTESNDSEYKYKGHTSSKQSDEPEVPPKPRPHRTVALKALKRAGLLSSVAVPATDETSLHGDDATEALAAARRYESGLYSRMEAEKNPQKFLALKDELLKLKESRLMHGDSQIHGRGVFAKDDLSALELICEYRGELISKEESEVREQFELAQGNNDTYLYKLDSASVVDARHMGETSFGHKINHSCEPNCKVRIYTHSCEGEATQRRFIFVYVKSREISKGDEITIDYKLVSEPGKPRMPCNCLKKRCREFIDLPSGGKLAAPEASEGKSESEQEPKEYNPLD